MTEIDLMMKIERLLLALQHAKKEYYYRGRRDMVRRFIEAEEREEAIDLDEMYARCVQDLKKFPELQCLMDTQH